MKMENTENNLTSLDSTLLSYTAMVLFSTISLKFKKRRLETIPEHLTSAAAKRMFNEFMERL
jgi:uncharacterized membrane-anchored protein